MKKCGSLAVPGCSAGPELDKGISGGIFWPTQFGVILWPAPPAGESLWKKTSTVTKRGITGWFSLFHRNLKPALAASQQMSGCRSKYVRGV